MMSSRFYYVLRKSLNYEHFITIISNSYYTGEVFVSLKHNKILKH